jgi:hypothetical protein
MKRSENILIIGDQDPFFTESVKERMMDLLKIYHVNAERINYSGDHRVYPEILNKIVKQKLNIPQ